jgi:hypothetical protein
MDNSKENKVIDYSIIVNAREKMWLHDEINFDEVVVLAYGLVQNTISYTVTYKKGHGNKPEGIMVKGDSIKVHNGMLFNVIQTSRS